MSARVGVQLYTVRDEWARDLPGTLRTIASLGYEGVELFGAVDAGAVRAVLDELGLEVAGRHVNLDADLDAVADDAAVLRCNRVALAWIDPVSTPAERDAAVERIVAFGERARTAGLEFAFHNHWSEVPRLADGVSLLECLPAWIALELDLGWVWYAGASPLELLAWAQGRTPLVHLKDLRAREPLEFCPVGDGAVGYETIVPRASELGVEWLVVEQDELDRAPADALRRSFEAVAA